MTHIKLHLSTTRGAVLLALRQIAKTGQSRPSKAAIQDDQNDLLELIESRFGSRSFLITSQMPMHVWHDAFDNKTVTDAVMDRVIHGSYHIQLSGEPLRKTRRPTIKGDGKG